MQKIIYLFPILSLCLQLTICSNNTAKKDYGQGREIATHKGKAEKINNKLGKGINLGNVFEDNYNTLTGNPHNPWESTHFELMAQLGFTHVRIPVRWESRSSDTTPYTINASFLEQIKEVVDQALKNKLHVILNMHHHEELRADPAGQEARFLSQWQQIGSYFKDYPDSLLFEILNEPVGNITPKVWNHLLLNAFKVIRKDNPDRIVLIGTAEAGGVSALHLLELPQDDNIILTVHYYKPFEFTHQGAGWTDMDMIPWIGTRWYDTEIERETIAQDFEMVSDFAQKHNVPVHIGEFGAINKGDIGARAKWVNYLVCLFEQKGFSWAYWDFYAGFGIYNRQKHEFVQPLVDALLDNSLPAPGNLRLKPVYTADFSAENNDGWILQQAEGRGTLTYENEQLIVDIEDGGVGPWHLQLVRDGLSLEKGKQYHISLTISSSPEQDFPFYISNNSSERVLYSGFYPFSAWIGKKKTFTYHFKMMQEDDNNAKMVFDLGKNEVKKFVLSNFTLNEIDFIL